MTSKIVLILLIGFLFYSNNDSEAQSFGFGCLGLSGVYGGYSYQTFQANGLNYYLNSEFTSRQEDVNFSSAHGFRIGANIFRAKFAEFFLTAKGYYQFLDEYHTMEYSNETGVFRDEFNLSMDYWAFGFDLGLPVARFVDWKIFEGLVTLNKIRLKQDTFIDGQKEDEILFKKSGLKTGYYFGTGLVVQLIPAYVTIEGSAGYNFITLDKFDDTILLPEQQNEDFINSGGISISIQANLSIPL